MADAELEDGDDEVLDVQDQISNEDEPMVEEEILIFDCMLVVHKQE